MFEVDEHLSPITCSNSTTLEACQTKQPRTRTRTIRIILELELEEHSKNTRENIRTFSEVGVEKWGGVGLYLSYPSEGSFGIKQ